MTPSDDERQDEQKRECFLCTLDPRHSCHEAQLEGHIIAAQERQIDGVRTPVILLDAGAALIELRLDETYYRSLVREIKARDALTGAQALTIRVYHLPAEPELIEQQESRRYRYTANSYTLAVLEPDTLLNITDLNMAEYCPRQYILNRLSPSAPSAATVRGNLVHHCFKELLKEHDRGKFRVVADEQAEPALLAMHRHLEQALDLNSIDLALANLSVDAMRADVIPHLESLAHWYESERDTLWDMPTIYADSQGEEQGNQVRAETFLLAPEIGLRGRLDLFWQQSGRQRLLELKTGGANGVLPRREHRWQVYGYHALLAVRRDSKMKKALATLLYSGTPGRAQSYGIPSSIREIQRVNETRNTLILSRITGVPPTPPGPARCTKCAMLNQCQSISDLLHWQPPEPEPRAQVQYIDQPEGDITFTKVPATQPLRFDTVEDRNFFTKYYRLLQMEGHAGEQQQALLWKTPVVERLERGTAISGLEPSGPPEESKDGWAQTFRCDNTSELREGDEILLSNGNPITGEVVTGTVLAINSETLTVWTREFITHPTLVDRYDNDLVHVRTLQNLLRWLQAESHVRDLVAGKVRPRFIGRGSQSRSDFNSEQNLAVERAMQMQDYLLIHGPPGTGKTSVIAEIVKQLCQQGQRVMLAAFTNQAVDNMLRRLDREQIHNYLRLGHDRSVDDAVKHRLLKELVGTASSRHSTDQEYDTESHATIARSSDLVHNVLRTAPIIATTTATWSSDKYSLSPGQDEANLHFDVAIIDEAGQLTVPAILGALRFARCFILVGDEKQLPPLVLSKEAAEQGLSESLFSSLKRLDENYMQEHPLAMSACVPLRTQYRMNKWISHFASTVFYDRQLLAHASVAERKLAFAHLASRQSKEDATITSLLEPTHPLVFLDVHDDSKQPEAKHSHAEARAVRSIVAGLLARGIAPKDIGVIAPYRAQVANIRRHLFSSDPESSWQALPTTTELSVDTVDRFQGGERVVIIMSFATAQEPALQSQRREFLINPHRLNVALTRAQRKLILVGSISALEHLPIFSRLIAYCRSMQTLISSR